MPERRTAAPATTDQTTKRNLDSEPDTKQETKFRLDLSLAQVVGGALAAMTAAALGSRLSPAGTVAGAALASDRRGERRALHRVPTPDSRDRTSGDRRSADRRGWD